MATSFNSGFALGNQMFNQAERNRLLALQDERDAEAHKARMEEAGLRMAGMRRVEDATQNLDRITNVGIQNPEAIKANDADFDMAVEATGRGLAMPAAAPQQPEWRKATGLELNDAQARLAAAKGDIAGMETLRLGRKGIEFEEGYKKYTDEWSKMDDAAKGALIDKLSLDAGVKGYGSWVPGKGKTAGYMNYMAPGADPVKLSAKEAGDLFVLTNLMQIDPIRARAEMDKVSDKVRTVAAQAFDAQSKGVTANNTAAHYAAQDANDAARTAAQGQYYGALRDRANRPQAGDLQKFQDAKGNAVLVDVTGLKRNPDGTVQMPTGLRPINARPEMSMGDVTARAKAYVESGMPDPDNPKVPLSMQKAVRIVQAEAAGGYKSAADRIADALIAQEGEKTKPAANTATGVKPYNQRLQEAYDAWQAAKGPWYMPTPAANYEARAAERVYEELLRNPR